MKKIFVCFTAVMAVALCLTSCKKEEKTNSMQFRATMETSANDNSKTTLNGTNIEWVAGDEVTIYGLEQSGTYTAQPESSDPTTAILTVNGQPAQGRPYCAIYPASLGNSATSFTLPAEQVTVDGSLTNFPMYAKSYDENLAFKNLCGVLKIHLEQEGAMVSRIVVTAATEINGNYSIDNSGELPSISYVDGGSFTTTLICTTPQDITNGKDFYVIMPAGSYSGLNIKIQNAGYGVEKNVPESTTIEILRSKYSTLGFSSLNMPIPPDDDHPWGLFSVNDNLQVWVAPGNLQYNKQTEAWRFAEHQYDVIGYTASWMGLFGWGVSGYNDYMPNLTSTDTNVYPHPYTFGEGGHIISTEYDWAWHNAIGNDPAHTWRGLNRYEFEYLMGSPTSTLDIYNHMTKRGQKMWSRATLNINGTSIKGVVILPDIWYDDATVNFGNAGGNTSRFGNLVYDEESWAEMEAKGAAFLPCAGTRRGTSVSNSNGEAWDYWHGTAVHLSRTFPIQAARFHISNTGWNTTMTSTTDKGYAIRPVKDYVPANSK